MQAELLFLIIKFETYSNVSNKKNMNMLRNTVLYKHFKIIRFIFIGTYA